ncbi:hypothetical protein DBV15_02459 [Temnothorax longispinosus]|uniref:Uncharacterized protein n=1 Tax=Temnothorax longispinosus TaxID=300112 RepID=A0A4S2L1A1_9HYME|nr:hypothetical protein DBV15_02459 [Temnothorax longispinosus]
MSGGNVYIRCNTSPRVSVEEGARPLRLAEERSVREVEANEFDRKSFPRGSSLRCRGRDLLARAITKSGRDEFAGAKAKVTRATPPSFVCASDVEPSGDNTFVKSIDHRQSSRICPTCQKKFMEK